MEVTGGSIATGTAFGDLSGYTLTLTGQELEPANFIAGGTSADPFAGYEFCNCNSYCRYK